MFCTKENVVLSIREIYDALGEACVKCVYGCILRPHVLQGLSGTGTGWVYLDTKYNKSSRRSLYFG